MSDWRSLIGDEASAGVSFSNIFIGVGTAIVGAAITSPPERVINITLSLGVLMMIVGFYSTICYANTHGILRAETASREEAIRPIVWGNALSEYFGVYILNYIIPFLVLGYTGDIIAVRVTYTILMTSFLIYHLSDFDLLERLFTRRWQRVLICLSIVIVLILGVELHYIGSIHFSYLSLICLISLSTILTFFHIRKSESSKN